ncbi:MAG: DUF357 domain-containing protein [Candidatus Micrarchaeota archaeon]|nr:DUF357 domain-containing protein [Candidatus Micrarchaeota archaeon]
MTRERIESDIQQFYENLKQLKRTKSNEKTIELAERYCQDAKYFLEKEDLLTAFGCINYAHGLLDALRKPWEKK